MPDAPPRLQAALEGRYRIEREIGRGGMATVYLADDLRHQRSVALKVLAPDLAAAMGAERFLGEIRTTANLQHPHILPLFDSGEADGFLYYVMPFVEGETLADRLHREGQLPVAEAIGIAESIAAALQHAHERGVIHRDIKPANILFMGSEPMVADFGIAIAGDAAVARLTSVGQAVGTVQYMSPEQAAGADIVDARTDIYALGAVLYEMLTGEPPYGGPTSRAILLKALTTSPPRVSVTRETVPQNVDAAVHMALARTPADRFRTARAFAEALRDPAFRLPREKPLSDRPRSSTPVFALVAVLAVALVVFGPWAWQRQGGASGVSRYQIAFAPGEEWIDASYASFALAPDGGIVYVGPGPSGTRLWVKRRESDRASALSGTDGARSPIVSPDGEQVLFGKDGRLWTISLAGGPATPVADSVDTIGGAAWLDDGSIIYVKQDIGLVRRWPDGSQPDSVWPRTASRWASWPTRIPAGNGFLFTQCDATCSSAVELWTADLDSGESDRLIEGAFRGWVTSDGILIFVRTDGAVLAAPFDPRSLSLVGDAVPVMPGVQVHGTIPDFALSDGGTLLYVQGLVQRQSAMAELVWVDRETGDAVPVDPDWAIDPGANVGWSLSPDHTKIAINVARSADDNASNIWIKDLVQGDWTRLTAGGTIDFRPRWSPDGRFVLYMREDSLGEVDVYQKRADGIGDAELVLDLTSDIGEIQPAPDGRLIVRIGVLGQSRDIVVARPGETTFQELVATNANEKALNLSPDSSWLAFDSDEAAGTQQVFIVPYPNAETTRILVGDGRSPLWSHSGEELFYVNDEGEMVVARFEAGPEPRIAERRALWRIPDSFADYGSNYTMHDVSGDDQRLLMLRYLETGPDVQTGRLIVTENWLVEVDSLLKR